MSRYSVIVVARDQVRQLLGTLLALRQHARPCEVLLVDNQSSADLGGVARLSQLPIRCLRLPEHRSLGAAFNVGLEAASCDSAVLLHGDVLLESDPTVAVEFLAHHPDVGVVGAKLLNDSTPTRRVLHAGYQVGRGRVGPTSIGRGDWDRYHETADVAAVSDACMAVHRTSVRFDERYWFRLQDVDFCFQYRQAGSRVVFLPSLRAVHLENGGVNERRTRPWWGVRQLASHLLYHERWCSNEPLERHPRQPAVGGEAGLKYLSWVDAEYAVGCPTASDL
jgi:GT2 family glycosyltransferase